MYQQSVKSVHMSTRHTHQSHQLEPPRTRTPESSQTPRSWGGGREGVGDGSPLGWVMCHVQAWRIGARRWSIDGRGCSSAWRDGSARVAGSGSCVAERVGRPLFVGRFGRLCSARRWWVARVGWVGGARRGCGAGSSRSAGPAGRSSVRGALVSVVRVCAARGACPLLVGPFAARTSILRGVRAARYPFPSRVSRGAPGRCIGSVWVWSHLEARGARPTVAARSGLCHGRPGRPY